MLQIVLEVWARGELGAGLDGGRAMLTGVDTVRRALLALEPCTVSAP